jgi:hypothetical protein
MMTLEFLSVLICLCFLLSFPLVSSKYYVSSWTQCDVNDRKEIQCILFEYPNELPLTIRESEFHKPFLLQNKIRNYLCQYTPLSSIYMYNVFQKLFVAEAMFGGVNAFPENFRVYSTLFLYTLQKYAETLKLGVVNTSYSMVTMERFNMCNLWPRIMSSSIIISGDACYSTENCPHQIHNNAVIAQLVDNLINELEEFLQISEISLFYGFAIPVELVDYFQLQCNQFKQIFSKFPEVRLYCHYSIIPERDIPYHFPYDFRETLAVFAHQTVNSDYYFLLDSFQDLQMITPNWLLTALQPLLLGGFYQGFGMTASFLNHEKRNHLPGSLMHSVHPILTRKHFEYFHPSSSSFSSSSSSLDPCFFSSPYLPSETTNLLFSCSYEMIGGLVQNEVSFSKLFTKPFPLTSLEDYYDQLQQNKRVLLEELTAENYFRKEKDYFRLFVSKPNQDILLDIFCQLQSGCRHPFQTEYMKESRSSYERKGERKRRKDRKRLFVSEMDPSLTSVQQEIPLDFVLRKRMNRMIRGGRIDRASLMNEWRLEPAKPFYYNQSSSFSRIFPSISFSSSTLSSSSSSSHSRAKVAVITAIYGAYESSCKEYAKQTMAVDFICFTDNPEIPSRGWIVDTTPYHLLSLRKEFFTGSLDEERDINALHHNFHPFNIAKFYKLSFHEIPILKDYKAVIWLDGTIRITNPRFIGKIYQLMFHQNEEQNDDNKKANNDQLPVYNQRLLFTFEHIRNRRLETEVSAALSISRYNHHNFNGVYQPIQPIRRQWTDYQVKENYSEDYWLSLFDFSSSSSSSQLTEGKKEKPVVVVHEQYGMWCTCFIAFNMIKEIPNTDRTQSGKKDETKSINPFLDFWYEQNRIYSTEDQVSFPFTVQKLGIFPFPLPNEEYEIYGSYDYNNLYVKMDHGL